MLRSHYLIEFIKKEDSYFNWSKSGSGKKSVKRTVPLTLQKIGVVSFFVKKDQLPSIAVRIDILDI